MDDHSPEALTELRIIRIDGDLISADHIGLEQIDVLIDFISVDAYIQVWIRLLI